ncbi:type I-E CRISPR-associated protein Cas6/Cse3/CasE [Limnobaculum xujianqingii]|uniref:type I-E CRISPR-associated protein Cas6/Cse3/CasE n=1 Tax=Limnobaculum xujianqingii TaxID=2738837 RepID=UPI00112AF1E8|nr:type I-E CRISPR-associated protein Cas6/Cse3/CasE [Limnobaculum xujianqingii]
MNPSLFASVLQLDRQAIRGLRVTDAYSLHRVVYSLFTDIRTDRQKQASTASGIVYADKGGNSLHRQILLLSDRPPATKTPEGYGAVETKPLPMGFLNHSHYRFQVIVNPTRRDAKSHKLIAVRGREAVAQWFSERAPLSWGFHVIPHALQVNQINVLNFSDKQQNPVTLAQAHLQGILQVTDLVKFSHSFSRGIGRGRTFGCGLLQISPHIDAIFE